MYWHFTTYTLVLLASGMLTLAVTVYVLRQKSVPGALPLALTMLAVSGCSLANALELAATDLQVKLFWANLQYFAYALGPVGWLVMALQYTGRDRWLARRYLLLLCLLPFMTIVLVWSNDLHGLMRRDVHLDLSGPIPMVGKSYGPWFYLHTAYSYLLLTLSTALLLGSLLRSSYFHRRQPLVLLAGVALPIAWNAAYVAGVSPIERYDLTPAVTGLGGVIVAWGMFRWRLFDIVPVAHDRVIAGMIDGVVILDTRGHVVDLNPAAQRVLGVPIARAVGLPASQLLASWPELAGLLSSQGPSWREVNLSSEGERRSYEVQFSPLANRRGIPFGQVMVLRDVTERKHAEDALQDVNQQLSGWVRELEQRNRESILLNEMGDLLQTCLTEEEARSIVSQSCQKLFPEEAGALMVVDRVQNVVEPAVSWGAIPKGLCGCPPDGCRAIRRGRIHRVSGERSVPACPHLGIPTPQNYICVPLMAQEETLGVLHVRSQKDSPDGDDWTQQLLFEEKHQLAISIAEHGALALANLRLRESLREQAIRDSLTGLFNRRYLEETLERELSRALRRETTVGVIMLDLDNFKRINDRLGHEAGDALLSALGDYLRTHVRGEDIPCRFGGDEFLLIMPEATLEATRQRAEELREGAKRLSVLHRHQALGAIGMSLGVAAFPEHGANSETLLRAADVALYRAKAEGRDRTEVATPINPRLPTRPS